MVRLILFLIVSIQIIFVAVPNAISKEKIIWFQHDWPPAWILEGEYKGLGVIDLLVGMIEQKLPQYEHHHQKMSWSRAWISIKHGEKVCHPLTFKTEERMKYAVFSDPARIVVPVRIIMKNTTIKKLGIPRSYDLVKIMHDQRLSGQIQSHRYYGFFVDSIIDQHLAGSNLTKSVGPTGGYTKMILYDRIDYTIEYSLVAKYVELLTQGTSDVIGSIKIEGTPDWVYSYSACPDNAWGRKVIGDINQVIREIKTTPEYLNMIKKWWAPEDKKIIEEAYQNNFLK